MNTEKTHIYFVPGLAAGKEIFKNIRLPEDRYELHILEWKIPESGDTLEAYAKRMSARVKYPNGILVGVSFGGVMAQEMAIFAKPRKLIIISSVKSKQELPLRLKLVRKTGAYKLLPTGWALSVKDLTKLAIGPRSKKRLSLYQEYLSVRDKSYLDWAIKQMVCWDRTRIDPKVIHLHGDADMVFPIKHIQGAEILEGGTHVMILNKGSWISERLQNIIEKEE